MRMLECEDMNKHPEYMNLRIWECENAGTPISTHEPEDARLQGSTLELEDMRTQGSKREHMNLQIWGCKDVRIQASTQEHKDITMWGCEDIYKSNISNMKITSTILLIIFWNITTF